MTKVEDYRNTLRTLYSWDDFLRRNSGLPGSRANQELLEAVVMEGTTERFFELLRWTPDQAPEDSPESFLAMAGAAGLGERVARGERGLLARMRMIANDPRGRVREGIAFGLQHLGGEDTGLLLSEMRAWSRGSPLERRAAVAAVAEPGLLSKEEDAAAAVDLTDRITATLLEEPSRGDSDVRALRQTLGHAWSVLIAEAPKEGKKPFERWSGSDNTDIHWVVRENLRKRRLQEAEPEWAARMLERIGDSAEATRVRKAASAKSAAAKAGAAAAKALRKKASKPTKKAAVGTRGRKEPARAGAAKSKAKARSTKPSAKKAARKPASPKKGGGKRPTGSRATRKSKATPASGSARRKVAKKPAKAQAKKAARRSTAKNPAKRASSKKASKKASRKAAPAKKAAGRKTVARKAARKKAPSKRPPTRKKAPAKKPVAKKPVAKKRASKKPGAKKAATKRRASKKPGAKKAATKKSLAASKARGRR